MAPKHNPMQASFAPLSERHFIEAEPHWVINLKEQSDALLDEDFLSPEIFDEGFYKAEGELPAVPSTTTWEGLPEPDLFIETLQRYYPKYKDDIIYIGRGIFAIKFCYLNDETYYIIGEVNSERMDTEDFLNGTDIAEKFKEFKDIVAFTLNVYIYDPLQPDVDDISQSGPF